MRPRITLVCLLILAIGPGAAWAQKAPRRPTTPAQKLKREIPSVKLVKMPFMRVLKRYSEISGLKIQADWQGLEIAGITKEKLVTLRATKIRVDKLLDLTLDSIALRNRPLAWYVTGGAVHVTSQMRAMLRNRLYIPSLATGSSAPQPRAFRGVRQITFSQTPLRLAIDFFRDITGVNFHVNWRALESVGITRDTPITLNVRGVSVARAMDLVLGQLNVGRDRFSSIYWIVQGGIVQIATGEAFNRTTKVKIYDVADLLMVVPNFKAARINLSRNLSGSNNTGGNDSLWDDDDDDDDGEEESRTEQRERLKETLIEMIQMSIGEEMWAPTGKGSIRFLRDKLIISQTPLGFKLLSEAVSR